jgi:hypothetical protein
MPSMKRTFALLGLMGLLATLLLCADATGKWKGTFDAAGTMREIVFDMKTSDGALTGTVGGLLDRTSEIKEGKVQGDTVSFWFMTEYEGNPIKLICKGQLAGDEIHFTMGLDDGQWSTEFVAKKSS